jgi:hypothetical protein
MLFSAIIMAGLYYYLTKDLPSLGSIADYRPGIITKVYSDDGIQIGEFATEKKTLKQAVSFRAGVPSLSRLQNHSSHQIEPLRGNSKKLSSPTGWKIAFPRMISSISI